MGRRLLKHEYPSSVTPVIDLTCEFSEYLPHDRIVYHNFQILDASSAPLDPILTFLRSIRITGHVTYIHCAQGHGRTGTITALLLVILGEYPSPQAALKFLQQIRPSLPLNANQYELLSQYLTVSNQNGTNE